MSTERTGWLLSALVGLGALLWWLPFSIEPPGRDQSLFLAQSQALLDGAPLYTEIWEHKPPGVLFAYAAAQALFGRGYFAVHLLGILAGLFTVTILTRLVWRQTRCAAGALGAGLLYAAYYSGPVFGGFWSVCQAEVLMDPLLALVIALLIQPGSTRRFTFRCFAAGLMMAAIVALKYSTLPMAALFVLVLADGRIEPGERWKGCAVYFAGIGGMAALWCLWLLTTGRFAAFWSATVVFNRMHGTIAARPRTEDLADKIVFDMGFMLPFYLLAALAVLQTVLSRRGTSGVEPAVNRVLPWGVASWALALTGVFWQAKFWSYHNHVMLLPLCLIAGAGLAVANRWVQRTVRHRVTGAAILIVAMAGSLIPYARYASRYVVEHRLVQALRGTIERDEFWSTYRWGPTDYDVLETFQVAERLNRETAPDDRLFVWGFEPGLYVYAERRPASRFFYDYPLMPRFEALHAAHVEALLEDLRTRRPARIAVLRRDATDIEKQGSVDQLQAIPELVALLNTDYEQAWTQGDFFVLKRKRGR